MSIIWTNKNLQLIHHEYIVEYDIRSANTSLMRYYGLAKDSEIDKLTEMKKEDREVAVGKMMRRSSEFAKALEKAFTDIVNEFVVTNGLDREEDIVSIKKDAVFVRNRSVRQIQFGDSVTFRPKGQYSGFLQIPKIRTEFYYQKGQRLDVKGISDELLPLHEDGVLDFIGSIFEEAVNWIELQKFMKEYAGYYKRKELSYNAYRQFDMNSKFLVHMYGQDVLMDTIDDTLLEYLDISFNYVSVYLECLKIIVGR